MTAASRIKQALAEQWPRRNVKRVELRIPAPPSTNALYRNRTGEELARARAAGKALPGRAKTTRYRTWLQGAAAAVNMQRPGHVAGAFTLCIILPRQQGKNIDLDNIKALPDLLKRCGVLDDDREAEWILLGWSDAGGHEATVIVNEGSGLSVLMREAA